MPRLGVAGAPGGFGPEALVGCAPGVLVGPGGTPVAVEVGVAVGVFVRVAVLVGVLVTGGDVGVSVGGGCAKLDRGDWLMPRLLNPNKNASIVTTPSASRPRMRRSDLPIRPGSTPTGVR
jgi:hypothetical protein